MPTDKQIEANRRNSQHSTGPRTPEGKSVARLNSFKHGIFAEAQIIHGEDKAAYEALRDDYVQRFEPAAPEEETLVANLIHYSWSLVRFRRIECRAWDMRLECPISSYPAVSAHILGFKEYEFLQRRTNSTHRQFHRDMELLTTLQAARKEHSSTAEPIPQPTSSEPLDPKIGFVPPNHDSTHTNPPVPRNEPAFPLPPAATLPSSAVLDSSQVSTTTESLSESEKYPVARCIDTLATVDRPLL